MDLWIRSQDRRILGKYNDIAVRSFIDDDTLYSYQIVGYFDKDTEFEVLGIYTTEERALEVLDEIQAKIMNSYQLYEINRVNLEDCTGIHKFEIPCQLLVIYEMPQE